VVCTTPKTDTPAPRSADLATRYAMLLAGALGPAARSGRSPSTLEAARAAATQHRSFIVVSLEVAAGELRVHADLYPVPRNIWDRTRNPSPGPVAHAFASARIDAEVRSFLAPVPLVALRAEKAALDEGEIVALGCHDLDADGALEVLTVSRRNVSIGRVRAGKLQLERRVGWAELSAISSTPWREPIATVTFPAESLIDVGVTDRARALRLDASLAPVAVLDGMPLALPAGAMCVRAQPGAWFDKLMPCRGSDPASQAPEPGFGFDVWAAARVVAADGSVRDVWAARDPSDDKLVLRDSTGRTASVPRVGAQVALADLDGDGELEVVTTRNVLEDRDDALVVRTWNAAGALRDRLTLPVPTGISALAACPPEGPGLRPLLLATRSELWVLR
jgi:hypothetical protein